MKKLFAFCLFSSLLLTGCSTDKEATQSASSESSLKSSNSNSSQESSSSEASTLESASSSSTKTEAEIKQEILDSLQGTWANAKGEASSFLEISLALSTALIPLTMSLSILNLGKWALKKEKLSLV